METESSILRKIKSALISKTTKELLIFSVFMAISASFWLLQALNEDREEVLEIPVVYKNIPEDVVITSRVPDLVRVSVKDKGQNLLNYRLHRTAKPLVFDFTLYSAKGSFLKITKDELQKQLKDILPNSSDLISFKPENFDLVYTRGAAKKVPVYITGTLAAKQQYEVTNSWTLPDSVQIYAPKEVLDTISAMYTTPVSYHELTDSMRFTSELIPIQYVKALPEQVEVHVTVEQLTEKTLEVPVETINVPEGKVLRTFPAKVKATFQTVLSYYKHVNPNNFIIQVDYNDIVNNPTSYVKPKILAPSIIKHLRTNPEMVEYLLEDTPDL